MEVELDVVGVDASVANAMRRVLLAEVSCYELLVTQLEAPHLDKRSLN